MDMSIFRDGKVHFVKSGVKGLDYAPPLDAFIFEVDIYIIE